MKMSRRNSLTSYWNNESPIPSDPPCGNGSKAKKNVFPLKGPISPDLNSDCLSSSEIVCPRIKAEALAIARNHQGKELAYLFNPAMKIVPIGTRSRKQNSKNHEKENYKKIKELQKANKERLCESSRQTPLKVVYNSDKFDHVQSKVAQQIHTPVAPRPSTTGTCSRQLSVEGYSLAPCKKDRPIANKQVFIKPNDKNKCPAEEKDKRCIGNLNSYIKRQRPKSHIKSNKEAVKNCRLKRSSSLSAIDGLKNETKSKEHKRGDVPKYLLNRKDKWKKEEEERLANLPDPSIPEGNRLMPETERKATLEKLQHCHSTLLDELKSMPLSRDTLRVKNRKEELERKLRETDSAIKIFSRQRVYVASDG